MSSTPSPSRASVTSAQRKAATSDRRSPAHEQQRGDHGVESAPAVRRGVGFDAPAVRAGTGGGGGRNCHLFAALCKLATRGSDEGLLTWARTLNREFAVPLSDSEVRGIWRSVCRYRARWRVQGHQQGWLWKQAARGRKGGAASGVVRRAGTPLEHDRAPWADLGVSRATWYRRFRAAKVSGEGHRHALLGTSQPAQTRWVRGVQGGAG